MLGKSLSANPLFQLLSDKNTQDAEAYAGLLLLIESHAEEALEYIKTIFPSLTDHGMRHSLRILEKLSQIMDLRLRDTLSPPELFCLIMAAMFHDMGLARAETVEPVRLREQHHLYAEEPLKEFMSSKLTIIREWKRLYNCILFVCQAHGMELDALYSAADFTKTDRIEGGTLRFGLLSVLLRIGDLLDLDENRTSPFSRKLNPSYFQQDPSRSHHLRHEQIDLYSLTPETITIQVYADNVEEYYIWEWWLHNLETDILQANTRVMPKLSGQGLMLPEPKFVIMKSEGAEYETEQLRFELTEEGRIWTILSQSVYTEEFDFIRELIQNGIDAVLMKAYLSSEDILPTSSPRSWGCWNNGGRVTVAYSALQGVLLIWDTGTGMDLDEVRRFLFQIADSGYRHLPKSRPFSFPAIAKFGIGFISCLSKCREIVLLTQPFSGAEGCRVRMFSNSVRAFFEKTAARPVSGTTVCMFLNRSYSAESVKEYLFKTFRYTSVPVEWLDLDEMAVQTEALYKGNKLSAPPDLISGYRISQEDFEAYYQSFDIVRESAYQVQEAKKLTVKDRCTQIEESFSEWRRQINSGTLKRRDFEKELSMLLRISYPLDRYSDIRTRLSELIEKVRGLTDRAFIQQAWDMLDKIRDSLDNLAIVQEQLSKDANQFWSPRQRIGRSELESIWTYQTCFIPLGMNFEAEQMISEPSRVGRYLNQNGVFIVQCGFNDWELGIEWQSVHVFLSQRKELVLRLFDLSEEYDGAEPVVSVDELLEDPLIQDYDREELMDAFFRHFATNSRENITLKFYSLEVQRERIIHAGEKRTGTQDFYETWHTIEDELETDYLDFLASFAHGLSLIPEMDFGALWELHLIKSGFFQDGIALDVDPTDITPFGMCRARVNLSGPARMDLNITRHQIDETHDTLDMWLARIGTVIQSRIVAQLKEAFQAWGFEGDISSLCTDRQGANGYLGEQSLRQLQRNIRRQNPAPVGKTQTGKHVDRKG